MKWSLFIHTQLLDNISPENFDEVLKMIRDAVRVAVNAKQGQTATNLAIVAAAISQSAQIINESIVIPNAVSLYCCFQVYNQIRYGFALLYRPRMTWLIHWRIYNSRILMCCKEMSQNESAWLQVNLLRYLTISPYEILILYLISA